MRRILTVFLVIVVFVSVMMLMRQPAYTDLVPNAEAAVKEETAVKDTTAPETQHSETAPVHFHNYKIQATAATCTKPAVFTYTCNCGDMYQELTGELAEHEYNVTVTPPTCTENGYSIYTCIVCEYSYTEENLRAHGHDYTKTTINPTCIQNGYTIYECKNCDEVYTSEYTEKTNTHVWSDWEITRYASPVNNGTRSRVCQLCQMNDTETFAFTWKGNYSVYVPNTDIFAEFVVADFNQSSVDHYDVVYSTPMDTANPFILGHNTGTMSTLYNVVVGQRIYVYWDGEVRVYEVVISEFAMQNDDHSDMVGQTTGTSIWDSVGEETLHLYTCYGAIKNHRWMVLAKRIA
ncbi:MAG: hypothetical protein IJZ68_08470 [Bacteroidaceae bacterium]|nr:hypothetical protein [Bacteroidaceae bacterium]